MNPIYNLCDAGRLRRMQGEWLEMVTKTGNAGYKKKHTSEYMVWNLA